VEISSGGRGSATWQFLTLEVRVYMQLRVELLPATHPRGRLVRLSPPQLHSLCLCRSVQLYPPPCRTTHCQMGSQGSGLSNPLLKRCPECTRERKLEGREIKNAQGAPAWL